MERDAVSGKLDFLFTEAEVERRSGQLKTFPSLKSGCAKIRIASREIMQ